MFDVYDLPCSLVFDDATISVEGNPGLFKYRREIKGTVVEKILAMDNIRIAIHPVEPLMTPKNITHYLMLSFQTPILLHPNTSKRIFGTFPVDIGIFVIGKGHSDLIDVFSFNAGKFTLYGDPSKGVLCKYWSTPIFPEDPKTASKHQGVLQLTIANHNSRIVQVTKCILNAYGMKLFYGTDGISMSATMKITGKQIAETDILDKPREKGLHKSIELYSLKLLSVASKKFVMEGEF
ncbi:DUF432 domain-containing protein [bacterium]|nr:DUF432 domain-containing protein [candidate division CSSED10-310 bacterium]